MLIRIPEYVPLPIFCETIYNAVIQATEWQDVAVPAAFKYQSPSRYLISESIKCYEHFTV